MSIHTDNEAPASAFAAADISALNHVEDAMLALKRKLFIINTLMKEANTLSETLGAVTRDVKNENRIAFLIFEMGSLVENTLAFAELADEGVMNGGVK